MFSPVLAVFSPVLAVFSPVLVVFSPVLAVFSPVLAVFSSCSSRVLSSVLSVFYYVQHTGSSPVQSVCSLLLLPCVLLSSSCVFSPESCSSSVLLFSSSVLLFVVVFFSCFPSDLGFFSLVPVQPVW